MRFGDGLVSEHVDAFADWLHQLGYQPGTVADLLRSLAAWTAWMRGVGFAATDLRVGFEAYKQQLDRRAEPRHRSDIGQWSLRAPSKFIHFLQERGVIEKDEPPPSPTTL